jgi:hypothetical protein
LVERFLAGEISQVAFEGQLRNWNIKAPSAIRKLVDAARMTAEGRTFPQQLQESAQAAFDPHIARILELIGDPTAGIGFRGSAARGERSILKGGGAINRNNTDIDALILSNQLADEYVATPRFADAHPKNSTLRAEIAEIQASIQGQIEASPPMAIGGTPQPLKESLRFRVWTASELQKNATTQEMMPDGSIRRQQNPIIWIKPPG